VDRLAVLALRRINHLSGPQKEVVGMIGYKHVEDMTAVERREEIARLRAALPSLSRRNDRLGREHTAKVERRLDRLCAFEAGAEVGYDGDYARFAMLARDHRSWVRVGQRR
jgi:hypothetical protein